MNILYSETDYNVCPPRDVPFHLLIGKKDILVICSRQGMVNRLAKFPEVLAIGIWEISEEAIKAMSTLFDVLVIVGRDRVHPIFEEKMKRLEEYYADCKTYEHSYLC